MIKRKRIVMLLLVTLLSVFLLAGCGEENNASIDTNTDGSTYELSEDNPESSLTPAAIEESIPDTSSNDSSDITVYVTNTGSKYHRDGCQYLSQSKIAISLSDAVLRYDPCSVCDPPVLDIYQDPPVALLPTAVEPPPVIEQSPPPAQTQEVTVYVTNTGSKYHNAGCSYLKSSNPISLSDAISAGYTPCSRCNPPK